MLSWSSRLPATSPGRTSGPQRCSGTTDLVSRTVDDLVPEHLRAHHVKHRSDYAAQPSVRRMGRGLRLTGRRKNGVEFRVEVSLSPLRRADGTYTICIVRDLSEYLSA